MNILGKEFITEQMPQGWVICEELKYGVFNIIDKKLSNGKHAKAKLQYINDSLVKDCQKLGVNPEQYWHNNGTKLLMKLINN
jgi:hypothetical protein